MADKRTTQKRRPELRAEGGGPYEYRRGQASRPPPRGGRRKRARGGRRLLGRLAILALVLAIWGLVGSGIAIAYFAYDLPDVTRIGEVQRNPSVTMVSADGQTLASFGDLYGEFIPVRQLPPHVPAALIATEDRRFHSHFGIDPIGLARAAFANLRAGRVIQGGSSITQQLAKNVFLNPDRTLKRKIQEVLLSFWLERTYTKEQILTIYLNRVYFGAGAYGIDAAANRYFDKSARRLEVAEGAMLIGLLKAPSRLAPTRDLAAAQRRAEIVLANMVETGMIGAADAARARARPASLAQTRQPPRNSRYFAEWVFEDVEDYAGRGWQDLIVTTTLDTRLQALAESALEKVLAQHGAAREAGQGALVAMTPDGAVRAMVGGRDWRESSFNRATQARRQPGSSFKYFVYLAGLEAGYLPTQHFTDRPFAVGDWQPKNLDGKHQGDMTLKQAFVRSVNTIAVQLSEAVGRGRVVEMARRLGVGHDMQPHPSIALGALEATPLAMTAAYAVTANGGLGVLAHGILEIRTRDGRVLFRRQGGGPGRLLDPWVAAAMQDMMAGVIEGGTGRVARLGWPAAGKTGTSQDFRDAWFIGFSGDLVAGVWIGNDDNAPMKNVTGGSLPAEVWKSFMQPALAGRPVRPLLSPQAPPPPVASAAEAAVQSIWQKILTEFGRPGAAPPAPRPSGARSGEDLGPDPRNQP